MSCSEGTLLREFLFLLMSCFWLCGSLLACVPDWHPPRKFSEISEKFPPTLCMSFVLYYTSSWVFHLSQRKMHCPSYCSRQKCKCVFTCMCVCIYIYIYIARDVCEHVCLYISPYMYICIMEHFYRRTGKSIRLGLFLVVISRMHKHFVP